MRQYGDEHITLEDWLVDLGNHRGATVVFRDPDNKISRTMPDRWCISDEELVVALCQMNCADKPQILRLAAQMISRNNLDIQRLLYLAGLERASPVISELAGLALKVEPDHSGWLQIRKALGGEGKLREPLMHWSRLAEPQFDTPPSLKVTGWKLVA